MASDQIAEPLQVWLTNRLEGVDDVTIGELARPHGGFSAETIIVPATVTRGGARVDEKFVLRMETAESAIYPTQVAGLTTEVAIQYRTMQQVAQHSNIPVAPLVGYEADVDVLGSEFFVMGFVDGEIPSESPMYTMEGFMTEAAPEDQNRLVRAGVATMAAIHELDRSNADLEWLTQPGEDPSAARQLRLWSEHARRELGDRDHPAMLATFDWLESNLDAGSAPVLNWGDARLGNVIWQDFAPACVTDFEAASVGPREVDLGWWLMFDHWCHETVGADRLPGEPTRDVQRALYGEHSGIDVSDTFAWELFAAARYCAIVVRVMNRMVERGDLPADNTIWLENPASTCLAMYRSEGGLA